MGPSAVCRDECVCTVGCAAEIMYVGNLTGFPGGCDGDNWGETVGGDVAMGAFRDGKERLEKSRSAKGEGIKVYHM